MEINKIPAQSMEHVSGKNSPGKPVEKNGSATVAIDKVDRIKFSPQAEGTKVKVDELKQQLNEDSPARMDKMKEAEKLLSASGHNDREVMLKTAEKMLEGKF